MGDKSNINQILVQLARLAVNGKTQDVKTYLDRTVYANLGKSDDSIWIVLRNLLQEFPQEHSFKRDAVYSVSDLPRDNDSRLQLLQENLTPIDMEVDPIWDFNVKSCLEQIIREQRQKKTLRNKGLSVSKALLFSGPPGVGKTLAAKWLANELNMPLYTLNLSSVMSSFLGKTGNNIRSVFDFATSRTCILLLDEFDSIAKKRNDDTEIGELKRLVTVLLQEIDNWSDNSILIAATNHQELLDPAVWRRFDVSMEFSLPSIEAVSDIIKLYFGKDFLKVEKLLPILSRLMFGMSYSDIQRNTMYIRKIALLEKKEIKEVILDWAKRYIDSMSKAQRYELVDDMLSIGISQHKIKDLTGISRDTIRKQMKKGSSNE